MNFLSNRVVITAILAVLAAVATFTATDIDDKIVAGISEWYNSNQVKAETLAPLPVAPIAE